jgi:hypothetical protein
VKQFFNPRKIFSSCQKKKRKVEVFVGRQVVILPRLASEDGRFPPLQWSVNPESVVLVIFVNLKLFKSRHVSGFS